MESILTRYEKKTLKMFGWQNTDQKKSPYWFDRTIKIVNANRLTFPSDLPDQLYGGLFFICCDFNI